MSESLQAWGSEAFAESFKQEMERFRHDVLPLAGAIEAGNRIYDDDLGVMLLDVHDDEHHIQARAGVFFAQIVNCLSCGESDPIDEAYCELAVRIDKRDASVQFRLLG